MNNRDAGASGRRPVLIDLGVVAWTSFLAAGIAATFFFAAVDPLHLRNVGPEVFENLSRESGYALGFFFFWLICFVSSALSVFLVRDNGVLRERNAEDHLER